jgi:FtsH-binding integral membrane protein
MEVHFNWVAIFVSALVCFFLGWAWHSPLLFMKAWMKEMGIKEPSKKDRKNMMKGMWKPMLGNFLALLVTAWVMTNITQFAGGFLHKEGLVHGMITGFFVWLGFVAAPTLNIVLWEKRSWKLYAIQTGHHLVSLALMGGILAAWQ